MEKEWKRNEITCIHSFFMNCFAPWRWSNTNFVRFRYEPWKLNLISLCYCLCRKSPQKMDILQKSLTICGCWKTNEKAARGNERSSPSWYLFDKRATHVPDSCLLPGSPMNALWLSFRNGKWVHKVEICRTCKVINYSETNERRLRLKLIPAFLALSSVPSPSSETSCREKWLLTLAISVRWLWETA